MESSDHVHRRIVEIYNQHAHAWDQHRSRVFFEQQWLNKFIDLLPPAGRVLDVGCGAGEPIAAYLLQRGLAVTGLDAAETMLDIFRSRLPAADWVNMDMRRLQLDTRFDGIVSWDGFFHLTQQAQRQVLVRFADHLSHDGALLLTIGHEAGEVTGTVEGEAVYHSSLDPNEYRTILTNLGFDNIEIKLEDGECGFHSVLLAQRG